MAFIVAAIFGIGLGGLLVVPPVALAHYFGRKSLGAIRGVTEPFVSGGQAVGAIGAGIVFDVTGSYSGTFPMFTMAAVLAIILLALTRRPKKPNQPNGVLRSKARQANLQRLRFNNLNKQVETP